VVLLVAFALLCGACGSRSADGLSVRGYPASLVFGAKPVEDRPAPAAPANAIPANAEPAALAAEIQQEEARPTPPPKFIGPPLRASRPACPVAPNSAAAAEAAPLNVPDGRRPALGSYRWKKGGKIAFATGQEVPLSGFETREIRELVLTTPTEFDFDTVQPTLGSNDVTVTSWRVKTAAVAETAGALSATVTAGDPERGLSITRIRTIGPDGAVHTDFRPLAGLLIVPLPIKPGEQVSSSAIDASTLETMQYTGQVVRRQQLDACGALVEGWLVSGTETSSVGGTRTHDYVVAPQLGGIPIAESSNQQSAVATADLTFSIGQLNPDPPATPARALRRLR
jgi:hypothetical protein